MKHILALGSFTLIYFLQGPSYVRKMWDHLPDAGDSIINTWILAWNAHALATKGLSVWDAPIFYPVENALTFSETMFGNLWLTLPVHYLTGNPVFVFNVLMLAAFVLSGFFAYFLAYDLTRSYPASVLAGILFSFTPYRWYHTPHLQLLPMFWSALAFFFAIRFFRSHRKTPFFLMLLMIWIQFYASIYLGLMLATALAIFTIFYHCFGNEGRERLVLIFDPKLLKLMLAGLAVSVMALLPLAFPYLQTAREMGFSRTVEENLLYSAEPLGFILGIPPSWAGYSFLQGMELDIRMGEGAVFLGLVIILLVVSSRIAISRKILPFNREELVYQKAFFWTGIILMVLMLGPHLILLDRDTGIPLPYLVFHHLVPGAEAMRAPARFFQPMLLCFAMVSALLLAGYFRKTTGWPKWIRGLAVFGFLLLLCFDYSVSDREGVSFETAGEMPEVYDYLRQGEEESPILEIPVKGFHYWYAYYQTYHWRPTIMGVSGWSPPEAMRLARIIDRGPSRRSLRQIESSPVETLVIHLEELSSELREKWKTADLGDYGFSRIGLVGGSLLWERIPEDEASSVLLRKGRPDRRGKVVIEVAGQVIDIGRGGTVLSSPAPGGQPAFRQFFLEEDRIALLAPNGFYLQVDPETGRVSADGNGISETAVFSREQAGKGRFKLKAPNGTYLFLVDRELNAAPESAEQAAVFDFRYIDD